MVGALRRGRLTYGRIPLATCQYRRTSTRDQVSAEARITKVKLLRKQFCDVVSDDAADAK